MNPAAIESHFKLVLGQWMVIIAVAWFFGRLGRKLGQPLAVGEIFGGLLLGPSVLGLIWPEGQRWLFPSETQQSLQLLAKLGLILLMFQVGMEFDYGHLTQRSRTVVAVSVLGIVVPFLLGLAIGPWLHRHFAPQVDRLGFQFFVCIALSISALPIMGRILLEMGLERTALGAVAISAAALDDVVGWVLLAVATALVTAKFSWLSLGVQLGGIACFLAALRVAVGPALRGFWQRSVKHGEHGIPGTYLAVLLIVLFACCLTTNLLGIFSIFGAFLLGVSIHQEVLLVKRWRRKFSDFVLVALVPVFFTNTGLRTEVGALQSLQAWVACGLVLLAAIGGKLGGCWLAARYGQGSREAVCVAALMNTRALMGLVAINIGADLGLLPKQLFTMFVIMALVTTAMTGPILHFALPDDLKALAAKRERDEAEA